MTMIAEIPTDQSQPRRRKAPKAITPVDRYVSQRLRAARIDAGLSQEKVASMIGKTFQQLQKYESAKNRVSCGQLAKLASIYRKPIGWFFAGFHQDLSIQEPDIGAKLIAAPHGRDLALFFLEIDQPAGQKAVVMVAKALAGTK